MAEVQNGIKGAVITIKIVGIGGGGNNVLRRLARDGFDRNQLLAINTDVRQLKALEEDGIPCLLIGASSTRGRMPPSVIRRRSPRLLPVLIWCS